MKRKTKTRLSEAERGAVAACVTEAERATSAEIAVVLAESSSDYGRAATAGAMSMGLLAAGLLALALGWTSMWRFLFLFALLYPAMRLLTGRYPLLARPFITEAELDEEVAEAAVMAFHGHGLSMTRERNAVLVYVSALEHHVRVLADAGIADKVEQAVWDGVAGELSQAMRRGDAVGGLCAAVRRCGEIAARHFPPRPDDRDELANVIVGHPGQPG